MSYTGSIITSIHQQLLKGNPADHARWACKASFANPNFHHRHHRYPDLDPDPESDLDSDFYPYTVSNQDHDDHQRY